MVLASSPGQAIAVTTIAVLVALATVGCDHIAILATATPDAEVVRAVTIRQENGLRTDRAYVEAVQRDAQSVQRLGISVTPAEAAELDERQLRTAVEARQAAGLLADEAWVREVLIDKRSVDRLGGLLVSPEEAAALDRRIAAASDLAGTLEAYGAALPEVWGGLYLEPDGTIVVQFAGDVPEHEAVVRALAGLAPVVVREVDWSIAALSRFREVVTTPSFEAWLGENDISLEGVGTQVAMNKVALEVSVDHPRRDVEELVKRHLGAHGWLEVTVRVVAGGELPKGELEVTVRDEQDRPIVEAICLLTTDLDGAVPAGLEARDIDPLGRCLWTGQDRVGATSYVVEVWRRYEDDFIGSVRVTVRAGALVRDTIRAGG